MRQNQHAVDPHPASPRVRRSGLPYLLMFVLGGGAALAGNYWLSNHHLLPVSNGATPTTPQAFSPSLNNPPAVAPLPTNRETATGSNSVATVVERVGSAVVRINSSRTVARRTPDAFNDPIFRRFFGSQGSGQPSQQIVRGLGSGVVISADGQVLTNAHVIDGADTVTVTFKDGRTLQGKVLGEDRVTDVAVVKVAAQNLPAASLGNSDQLLPGQEAIAIGNPLGLDNTVTSGIISATGRSISDNRVEFLQTDAAINPGNSGGPLLNDRGQVIGINTAIIQGAQGIGFAIPINTARRIAEQLISQGKVDHAYLGVEMVTLTPEIRQMVNGEPNSGINVQVDQGVLVARVAPNSPAATAGIRPGDVIEQINGQGITDSRAVQQLVDGKPVGTNLALQVNRQGQKVSLNARTAALPPMAKRDESPTGP